MGQLDKRTVIVTGAAQGIGAAYARGLVAEGANVVINDVIDPDPLVNELTVAGGDVIGITADVTDDDQIASMVAKTVEKYGRIDGLIIMPPFSVKLLDGDLKKLILKNLMLLCASTSAEYGKFHALL